MIGVVLAQLFAKAIDLGPSDPQDWGFGLVETSWGYLLYGRSARGLTIVKASADGTPLSAYRGLLPNQLIWLWITDFKKTPDGGFVACGYTDSLGTGAEQAFLLKLDSSANPVWLKLFGTDTVDMAYSLALTSDGGYLVGFESRGFQTYGNSVFGIAKFSSNGTYQWTKLVLPIGLDVPGPGRTIIVPSSDGGYYLVSSPGVNPTQQQDFLVVKVDSSFAVKWARCYGYISWDVAYGALETSGGNLLVWGRSDDRYAPLVFNTLTMLDPDGNLVWWTWLLPDSTDADSVLIDQVRDVVEGPDGLYAVSYTDSYAPGDDEPGVIIAKWDIQTGEIAWARLWNMPDSYDDGRGIIITSDGALAICGITSFGRNFLLLKLGSDGSYAGCVETIAPTTEHPPVTITDSIQVYIVNENVQVWDTVLVSTDLTDSISAANLCPPLYVNSEEASVSPEIRWHLVPGGLELNVPQALTVEIYSSDGRRVKRVSLRKGRNTLRLKSGVYFWRALVHGRLEGKGVAVIQ